MSSAGRLADRTAAVTGAGQGIGRVVAERFAAEGAKVAVVDVNRQAIEEVVAGIGAAGGSAIPVVCDVSSRAQVDEAATFTVEQFGPINILVSNAGVTRPATL